MTKRDLADFLRVSTKSITRMVQRGTLHGPNFYTDPFLPQAEAIAAQTVTTGKLGKKKLEV